MNFGVKFCEIFRATFSRVWVCDGKFHVKNGVKNGNFHANFTLLGPFVPISRCLCPLGAAILRFEPAINRYRSEKLLTAKKRH